MTQARFRIVSPDGSERIEPSPTTATDSDKLFILPRGEGNEVDMPRDPADGPGKLRYSPTWS